MHIGEPEAAALKAEGKAFVVDAEQVHHGGVEVVDVDTIAVDVVAEGVGFAVSRATFHAASRHPDGKAARVVVAPKIISVQLSL